MNSMHTFKSMVSWSEAFLLYSSSYGFSFIKGLVFELIGCLGYNVRPAYLE